MATREQKIAAKVAQFAGVAEAEVAAALNATDSNLPTKRSDVATYDAREILLSTGEWGAVVLASENAAVPEQVRGACIVLRDAIKQTSTIRISIPAIYSATANLLGALVSAGILTDATRNALMALADVAQSWAEMEGVGVVTIRDIGIARGNF
jgi:CBS domain-containing protein